MLRRRSGRDHEQTILFACGRLDGRCGGGRRLSAPAAGLATRAFWFLRHGETDWNAQNRSQGNVDIPLNAAGLAQARVAAGLLAHRGIVTLVSSPLSRARVTAEIVAAAIGVAVSFDDGLHEAAFGVEEGQPMTAWFADWIAGVATPAEAETFAALRVRATAAINRALARPAPVLVVAHGALFRAVRAEMGLAPNVRTPNATPLFCTPGAPWTLTPAG
jgi:probable phosphoglycerate mutase